MSSIWLSGWLLQGEIFAAEGYAKVTGDVGVCIATSGPGATNLVTGLADALLDSVPLVAITGQVGSSSCFGALELCINRRASRLWGKLRNGCASTVQGVLVLIIFVQRPGAEENDWYRCVSRDPHCGGHATNHQAQLLGHGHC